MAKQYGLIQANKYKKQTIQPVSSTKPSIFDDDSDSDSGGAVEKPTGISTSLKRQDRILQARAVEEDPTVYQYDELYDDMESKRKASKLACKDVDRKPKYIGKLLASADKRKRENERRIERQVQKEREAEGEEFKDKESFVTASYRAKLEEMKKLDEEERRREYLEQIGDVTKQGNLDGFYRHLYEQKGLSDKVEMEVDEEENEKEDRVKSEDIKEEKDEETVPKEISLKSKQQKRRYRKRDESTSDTEIDTATDEISRPILQHLPSNLDADSDFSIDSSDSEDESENKSKDKTVVSKNVIKTNPSLSTEPTVVDNDDVVIKKEPSEKSTVNKTKETHQSDEKKDDEMKEEKKLVQPVFKKPKIDIWKKRTVGNVFEDSLRRYFERKALREAGTFIRPV